MPAPYKGPVAPGGSTYHANGSVPGPSSLPGMPRTGDPSPESIPYITVPSMLASQPGDEYAFANPDAYNAWRQTPHHAPPRPPAPLINPAFVGNVPNGPRATRVDHWHAGLDPKAAPFRPPMANGIGGGQPALAGPSNYAGAGVVNGYGTAHVRPLHTTPTIGGHSPFAKVDTVQRLQDVQPDDPAPHPTSSYVPPHLRPVAPSQSPTPPSFAPKTRYQARPPPPVALPPHDYLSLSKPRRNDSGTTVKPKVLVMDLNGAIIYRTDRSSNNRQSYPRPYLSCLLDYLFLPEPAEDRSMSGDSALRPWSVFVWSSAQPHNVRSMVEMGFGPRYIQGVWQAEAKKSSLARAKSGEGRLLGVWARDKMGLSESDYRNKVQTFKDLRQVADHLSTESETSEDTVKYHFDLRNTVLLDDSPMKARFQPWNQLVIPEYGKAEFASSRTAAGRASADTDTQPEGMDCIVLAIIGMLEEMRTISNVPAWIRAGGLTRSPKPTQDGEDEDSVDESLVEDAQPALQDMPSHESFQHWYEDPKVVTYWIGRGRAALERKGIKVVHGIDAHGRSPSPAPEGPPVQSAQTIADLRQRRWSPSRPVSPSYDRQTETPNGNDTTPQPSAVTTRAVSPSGSAFGRRGFATMAQALTETGPSTMPALPSMDQPTHQVSATAYPPASIPAFAPVTSPLASETAAVTGPPSLPGVRPTDAQSGKWLPSRDSRWRTFTASEVSQYLSDLADRSASTSQANRVAQAEQTPAVQAPAHQMADDITTLKCAAEILKRHNDNVEPRRAAPTGPWKGELCVKCIKYLGACKGGKTTQTQTVDPDKQAKKAGKKARKKTRLAEAKAAVKKKLEKRSSGGTKGKKKAVAVSNAAKKEKKAVKGKAKAAADPDAARKKASESKKSKAKTTEAAQGEAAEGVATGEAHEDEATSSASVTKAKRGKSGPKATSDDAPSAMPATQENAEAGTSTPRRTLRPVDRYTGSTELVSPRRFNPRRSATNVDAIRAEAQLEADFQRARTSPKRVKAELGSPTARKMELEMA